MPFGSVALPQAPLRKRGVFSFCRSSPVSFCIAGTDVVNNIPAHEIKILFVVVVFRSVPSD